MHTVRALGREGHLAARSPSLPLTYVGKYKFAFYLFELHRNIEKKCKTSISVIENQEVKWLEVSF